MPERRQAAARRAGPASRRSARPRGDPLSRRQSFFAGALSPELDDEEPESPESPCRALRVLRLSDFDPVGAVCDLRAAALLARVVGRVEARALEVDGRRVQDATRRRTADVAGVERVLGHRLHRLERVAVVAFVFVDRHSCGTIIGRMRDPKGRGIRGRVRALAFVGALAALLIAAPAANAAFGISPFSAQPASKAAGANSDFTVRLHGHRPEQRAQGPDRPPPSRADRQPAGDPDLLGGRSSRPTPARPGATSATRPTTSTSSRSDCSRSR